MNEDQDRSRSGNGPNNLAILRHMALNVMQKDATKGSLRGKLKQAAWDETYLAKLVQLYGMRLSYGLASKLLAIVVRLGVVAEGKGADERPSRFGRHGSRGKDQTA